MFPNQRSINAGAGDGASGTAHTFTLPTPIVAGDEILVFLSAGNTGATYTLGTEAGTFSPVYEIDDNSLVAACFKKIADGSEGGVVVTVATALAARMNYVAVAISDWYGSGDPEYVVTDHGPSATTTPDSTGITPSYGTDDTFWINVLHADGNVDILSYPSTPDAFTGGVSSMGTAAAAGGVAYCYLQKNAASVDPGPFTTDLAGGRTSVMLAIRPAVVVSTPTITDASDESFTNTESVVITGTNFGASQGTGNVKISPTDDVADVGAVTQTVTAWGDTSITITVVKGSLTYLTGAYLFVTKNGGSSNADGYAVQVEPKVFIRETLVDLTSNPVASQTGLTALVWHAAPASSGTPSQVLTGLTTDGSGLTAWQISRGGLAIGDPVWLAIFKDGSPAKATMRKLTPSYE